MSVIPHSASAKPVCYDAVIVGAGVAGCCVARELARFDLRIAVLEAGNDVACGASRANSGIVHAGYDPTPGSRKAHYCVAGSQLFPAWADELGFGYDRNGSLVVAFDKEQLCALRDLEARALANGLTEVRLVDHTELHAREPKVSPEALGALLVPTGAICDPYGLTFAAAENAAENGVDFIFNAQVIGIEREDEEPGFLLTTVDGLQYCCRVVINAAGTHADELNNLVSATKLTIHPVRGEYLLYDTPYGALFSHTVFQTPSAHGKGVLVTPTVHGNLLIGPNATPQQDRTAAPTTTEGMAFVLDTARLTWPDASPSGVIANFAGLRAKGTSGDFVLGEVADVPGFFNIACLESPGLTAAPAVAVDIATTVATHLGAERRADFSPRRRRAGQKPFAQMDTAERAAAIAADPQHGRIVCRCCTVTAADIATELAGILPVLSLDTLKWRTNAMMGRCHGGFCTPELIAELCSAAACPPEMLDKRLPGSRMLVGESTDEGESTDVSEPQFDRISAEDVPAPAGGLKSAPTPGGTCESAPSAGGRTEVRPYGSAPTVPTVPYDIIVVGSGAAGLAAAVAARREGAGRVLLLDRHPFLGGILRQCIHNGFGLERFELELTGPEYAERETLMLADSNIEVLRETTALSIQAAPSSHLTPSGLTSSHLTPSGLTSSRLPSSGKPDRLHTLIAASPKGLLELSTKALILATGSRERGAGSLMLAGSRPAGVYSAGSAQTLINLAGEMPGRRVVIQGSGDIGLIMARRCVLAGAEVVAVYARSAKPQGLQRNVVQCLKDYGIPFIGQQVVTRLEGDRRLEAVWISQVDALTKRVIDGTEQRIACDTLLLSVGLLPENEIALSAGVTLEKFGGGPIVDATCATDVPGIYSCGNALHIHDLADGASAEGEKAGRAAARWGQNVGRTAARWSWGVRGETSEGTTGEASGGRDGEASDALRLSQTPPPPGPEETGQGGSPAAHQREGDRDGSGSRLHRDIADAIPAAEPDDSTLHLICVRCPKGCDLTVRLNDDGSIKELTGNGCRLGIEYARAEIADPSRIVTLSLPVVGSREPISAKTAAPIPKSRIFEVVMAAQTAAATKTAVAEVVTTKAAATTRASLTKTRTAQTATSTGSAGFSPPIQIGDILVHDIAKTGVDLIATKSLP